MLIKDLFVNHCSANLTISSIEIDSRLVKDGSVFFAIFGNNLNGAKFIDYAFKNGAIAVICDINYDLSLLENARNPAIIRVQNVYQFLIDNLQKFYSCLPKNILAVTGTNGKTSVAFFIQQMQEFFGKKSASIGTIGIKISQSQHKKDDYYALKTADLTTPDIVSLYQNLTILKQNGVDDVVIEASSIGLKQQRLAGLRIGLGAFTNFSQDHLDYHHTMQKYFACKMLLFEEVLSKDGIAILNADIIEFEKIKKIALKKSLKVFSYSAKNKLLHYFGDKNYVIDFVNNNTKFKIFSSKIDFCDANIFCALLAMIAYYQLSQTQIELLINNLDKLKSAQGRMQQIATLKNNSQIFIDYAHTPDALENVIRAARKMPHNRLCVLFGCGGDRDKSKRSKMGKIASDLADFVIVSDDNPRTECNEQIRKQILISCDLLKTVEIADRKNAINQAILMLKDNDILIIAGKGHEQYQIIGDKKFEFNEEKIVNDAINTKSHL
jgi:murE/murF fusion protein